MTERARPTARERELFHPGYVNDSISTLVDASDKNGIPHPNIITESGRALTAHHSVLIFEVLETTNLPEWDDDEEVTENDHELLRELYGIWDTLNQNRMLEAWHDAQQIREEALDLFSHGIVDLQTRAKIERLYWSIMREVNQIAGGLKHAPDEFRGLPNCWRINISVTSRFSSPAGLLGDRPDIPHHAHPASGRTAGPDGYVAGYHLRFGR